MPGDLPVLAKVPACTPECRVAFKGKPGSKHREKGCLSSLVITVDTHLSIVAAEKLWPPNTSALRSFRRGLTPMCSHTTSGNAVRTHHLSLPVVACGEGGCRQEMAIAGLLEGQWPHCWQPVEVMVLSLHDSVPTEVKLLANYIEDKADPKAERGGGRVSGYLSKW